MVRLLGWQLDFALLFAALFYRIVEWRLSIISTTEQIDGGYSTQNGAFG
jgi:hypothetical protein